MAGSANIAIKLDLTGDKALMRNLDRLTDKVGRRVLRKAMRAAARPVVKAAKGFAPVSTGKVKKHLKDSIGTRFKWYGSTGTEVVVVGPRIKYKKEKDSSGKRQLVRDDKGRRISVLAGQHGYIVEFGTGPRYTKKGAFRGVGPAQPFMRPAWDSQKRAAEKAGIKKLLEEVEREARRGR